MKIAPKFLGHSVKKITDQFILKESRPSKHWISEYVYVDNAVGWNVTAINEHISSTLFRHLGIPCQYTNLYVVSDNVCVQIRRFSPPTETSIIYSFGVRDDEVTQFFEERGLLVRNQCNRFLSASYEMLKCIDASKVDFGKFFNMLIVDTVTGNYDRHQGNWGIWYDEKTESFGNMVDIFDNELTLLGREDDATLLSIYMSTSECIKQVSTFPMWSQDVSLAEYLHEHRRLNFAKKQVLDTFSFILNTVPFSRLRKDILYNYVNMRCQILFDGKHPKDVVNNRPWLNPNLY
jgi:hypothetical protein